MSARVQETDKKLKTYTAIPTALDTAPDKIVNLPKRHCVLHPVQHSFWLPIALLTLCLTTFLAIRFCIAG